MTRLVVDASAVVDLLLRNERGAWVRRQLGTSDLHTPAHLDAEVFSALARLHRTGVMSADAVEARLRLLAGFELVRHPISDVLLRDAWSIRDNVAARDALYVVLARRIEATLLTTDLKLARAVPTVALAPDRDV
ncbi:MAG: type II toxin-antitoxin system VapC family toxin [Pseudonocardia sediminis]